jgi:cell division septation protein DedD
MAQDDYYYEIQLTNKQLVFYFMAGATGLILSFLAGVMVGRGVDTGAGEVQASRPVAEERVVAEEAPKVAPSPADLTYAQRLETDKTDDSLERPKGAPAPAAASKGAPNASVPNPAPPKAAPPNAGAPKPSTTAAQAPLPKPVPPTAAEPKPAPAAKVAPPKPVAEAPAASASAPGDGKGFTVQVGAFKDKATADSVVTRLKGKGFAAYVMSPGATEGGLFVVRVGSYLQRTDAERTEAKLRDQEKFRPYIVKN